MKSDKRGGNEGVTRSGTKKKTNQEKGKSNIFYGVLKSKNQTEQERVKHRDRAAEKRDGVVTIDSRRK